MASEKYLKYGRAYYERNKEKQIAANRLQRMKWKQDWNAYKATLSCTKCGQSHPAIIDFHHLNARDPSNKKVNQLIKSRLYAQAREEIKKCIVLCANCHRILHYEEDLEKKTPTPLDV